MNSKKMRFTVTLKWTLLVILVQLVMSTKGRNILFGRNWRMQPGGLFDMTDMTGNGKGIFDPMHGVRMGISDENCDDGIHGIQIDWDGKSTEESTCKSDDVINDGLPPFNITDDSEDEAQHECLDTPIEYPTALPLSGSHRPLWPVFGEYTYLPPQRWVHSLEHGAVVLLYHPCRRDAPELEALKSLLRGCLGKHVITPYRKIPNQMPYALLAYKHAVLLGSFNPRSEHLITDFIEEYALEAPETPVVQDGQYSKGLIEKATKHSELEGRKQNNICAFPK